MSSHVSKLLREHEVAEYLGISVRTLQHWRLVGDGPVFTKIGRCVRYEETAIADFVSKQRRHTTSKVAYAGSSY